MPHTRLAALIAAILIVGAAPGAVRAAVPTNDDPATATVIAALPFSDAVDLSQSTGEPSPFRSCEAFSDKRVWYSYAPVVSETISVSTGGDQRVELAVWAVGSGPTDLTLSRCAVDGSNLVATLTAGTHYL